VKLRLVTYNIHKCVGGVDRRYRPGRISEVIGHYAPDVVLLQEVSRGTREKPDEAQVELLGEELGLRHRVWYPNHRFRDGRTYGNAILSRYPLTDSVNIDLTMPLRKRRSVLHGRCRVRMHARHVRTVHVFNLHLGLSQIERKAQLRRFLASDPFRGFHPRTPVIVAGDFNDVWGTLGRFLEPYGFRGATPPIRTFPAWAPVRALDAVFVRGDVHLDTLSGSRLALARHASDHLPLIADLIVTS